MPSLASPSPSTGPLIPRLVNALLLRRPFYDAVAADPHATGPAAAVVCLAAIAYEAGNLYELSQGYRAWGLVLVLLVVSGLLRWLLYTAILYPIARLVCATAIEFKRLLRCLGFAEAPTILSIAGIALDERFLPWLQFGIGAWLLAATIVAVRSATRATTVRALIIGGLGFVTYLLLGIALDALAHVPMAPPAA